MEVQIFPSRLFKIFLKPEETKKILESPDHLRIQLPNINAVLRLRDGGNEHDKPIITRVVSTGTNLYDLALRSGFRTDKDHLEYLCRIGPVPIMDDESSKSVYGFVMFFPKS